MKIFYSDEELPAEFNCFGKDFKGNIIYQIADEYANGVFLAGPTPRDDKTKSKRKKPTEKKKVEKRIIKGTGLAITQKKNPVIKKAVEVEKVVEKKDETSTESISKIEAKENTNLLLDHSSSHSYTDTRLIENSVANSVDRAERKMLELNTLYEKDLITKKEFETARQNIIQG